MIGVLERYVFQGNERDKYRSDNENKREQESYIVEKEVAVEVGQILIPGSACEKATENEGN